MESDVGVASSGLCAEKRVGVAGMTKVADGFSVDMAAGIGVDGRTGGPFAFIRSAAAFLQASSSMVSAWARSACSASLANFSE